MVNFEIKSKLDELQAALLASHPTIPTLLRDIHRTLKAQPEQVTLLTDEELNIVVRGLEKQTNSYIAAAVTKATKSTTSRKTLSKATMDDLGF